MYHFHLHSLNRIYNSLIAYPQRRKANGTKDWRLRPYHHSHHVHSFQCDLLVFCIFYVKNYLHVKLRTYGCWINIVWKNKDLLSLIPPVPISLVKKVDLTKFSFNIKFRNFHTWIVRPRCDDNIPNTYVRTKSLYPSCHVQFSSKTTKYENHLNKELSALFHSCH